VCGRTENRAFVFLQHVEPVPEIGGVVVSDLRRDAKVRAQESGSLRHVVNILARDQINPQLAAGEIVTTGTLTRALPVSPGETWTTELAGVALDGLCVCFS